MTMPWLTLLVFTPLAASLFVLGIADAQRARRYALQISLVLVCLAAGIVLSFDPARPEIQLAELQPALLGMRYHLGIDGISALLVPVTVLVTTVILVAGGKRELTPRGIAVILATEAGVLGALVALDGALLTVFWILSLAPTYAFMRGGPAGPRRVYAVHAVISTLALACLAVIVARSSAGATLGDLTPSLEGAPPPIPAHLQTLVFALAIIVALTRMGVPPFHAWLPTLVADGPLLPATLVVSSNVGLYVLARLALWLTPTVAAAGLPILAGLAIVGALYGALVALGQRDLLRAVGYVAVSEACLTLIGLASLNQQSVSGALLEGVSSSVASLGLLATLGAVRARTGPVDVAKLGGLVRQMPRAAAAYFALSLAVVGFPGTIGFASDDLLLHGVLDAHPIVAMLTLGITALNGITLLKAGVEVFFGVPRPGATRSDLLADLLPRERGVVFVLALALLGAGLAPGILLGAREATIEHLVAYDAHAVLDERRAAVLGDARPVTSVGP